MLPFVDVTPVNTTSNKRRKAFHKRKNMPELPFEIWGEIHSYLTPDESKKLIGVNRYFFEAGMDEIYKEIRVYNVLMTTGFCNSFSASPALTARGRNVLMTTSTFAQRPVYCSTCKADKYGLLLSTPL